METGRKRAEQKRRSHHRIIESAARQLRRDGMSGAGVQQIMREAGLTHGGFYGHFGSKAELMAEAIAAALAESRERLVAGLDLPPGPLRAQRLLAAYLSAAHRDAPQSGCPLASSSADVARAPAPVRRAYQAELRKVIELIEADPSGEIREESHERAVGILALCVGGLLLARAVEDPELSDDILESCRHFGADHEREQKE